MAYDDGYYYGQCKIICESETVNDNGRTVAITDGKNTWSKALADKVAEFIVPGRSRYTVTLLDGNVTKYTNKFDAGYGECIHVMLAAGYDNITRSEFDSRMNAVEQRSTNNATEINGLKNRMGTAESNITNYGGRIATVETRSSNNATDISGLKTRMSTAESNINTHTSNISGLSTRMGSAETNITSVTNKTNTNTNDISGLKTRMTNVENTASSAKSKADTNASNISTQTGRIDTINSKITASDGLMFSFAKSGDKYGYRNSAGEFVPFKSAGAVENVEVVYNEWGKGSHTFTVTQAIKDNYNALIILFAPAGSQWFTGNIPNERFDSANNIFGTSSFVCWNYTSNLSVNQYVTVNSQYDGNGILVLGIKTKAV